MRRNPFSRIDGFTFVEMITTGALALIIVVGVLNVYIFVARSYTRTIGFGLPNEPTLEAQGRRTLAILAQDVQMTSAISSPSASDVTLTVPLSTGGTKTVRYYYNSTASPATVASVVSPVYSVTVPATSLARIDCSANTVLTLHTSLLTCTFSYLDSSGYPYTTYANYLVGIKSLSVILTAQTGNSANGTLSRVYQVASPALLFRNKSLLP